MWRSFKGEKADRNVQDSSGIINNLHDAHRRSL